MAKKQRTTVILPEELHRRVKAKAVLEGSSLSKVFRLLLEKWERGEIELPELSQSKPEEETD